ncbi:carboxymuconolactone decarboxylase family protein [Chitinimonas sp.]|uniref:carboxymuconolactone decarboxylase family protein n=1 Tax=Chitinimonas sp. TaxID=1934313 RepID=UPI0035B44D44
MSTFTLHNETTAPAASQPLLAAAKSTYGFVPNLFAGMAESPALLEGYMTLAGIFGKTVLSETERQVIMMTANRINECHYCMTAHSMISAMSGVPADVVEALRAGSKIADPKLEALRTFTVRMMESRGWPSEQDLAALIAAGYTRQTVLEVVLGLGLKLLSNYTNHIVKTPIDAAFTAHTWSR